MSQNERLITFGVQDSAERMGERIRPRKRVSYLRVLFYVVCWLTMLGVLIAAPLLRGQESAPIETHSLE